MSASVPPVVNVENSSWNDTSKLSDANCKVMCPAAASDDSCCQIDQVAAPARHGHAFRPAGRTRRVNDVAEIIAGHAQIEISVAFRQRFSLDSNRREIVFRQAVRDDRLRQQHAGAAVAQHEGNALGRIARIDRHIGPTSGKHAENCHRQVERSLKHDSHRHIGSNTHFDEPLSESIRATRSS